MSYFAGRKLRSIAKWVLTLALLGAASQLLDWQGLRETLAQVSIGAFVLAVFLLIPENLVLAIRWHLIMRAQVSLPLVAHVRHYFIAVFLNMFSPAQIGGDLYRYFSLRSEVPSGWSLAGAIMRERLIGVAGYALFFVVCFALSTLVHGLGSIPEVYWLGLAAFAAGLMLLVFTRPLRRILDRRAYTIFGRSISRPIEMVSTALDMGSLPFIAGVQSLSLVTAATWTLSLWVVARDLNLETDFLILGMAGILTDLIRALPITVQGIGVREGVFAFLIATTGASIEQGFAVGLAAYLAVTVAIIIVGIIGFALPVQKGNPPITQ